MSEATDRPESVLAQKITRVLAGRGLLKRDLARALSVSPQTATDICKGRSAVTLPHLRRLVEFFGLRADFWLDDGRLDPGPADATAGAAGPAPPLPLRPAGSTGRVAGSSGRTSQQAELRCVPSSRSLSSP